MPTLLTWPDPIAAEVDSAVTACLAAEGTLTPAEHQRLISAIDALQQRVATHQWHDDPVAYFRTRDLLTVAQFVETAAYPSQRQSAP
ncbi:hypothetical protein O7623_00520 [Solwaraspora sp. WMMD791]|uniref:hypothetical protein n=1 Tax=Solwaraspora sp. WMMD791 TaxID=3016086 RepID=UPI00249CC381|nr:hypothetical protein [Solwaraspora sp. WMMD791]WFE27738.1 hypothetical protein O7623_00520 [Solwaraspora sp. WMMD791]